MNTSAFHCRDKRPFMSSMRPDTPTLPQAAARAPAYPHLPAAGRGRRLSVRGLVAVLALAGLAACAKEDTLTIPVAPHPNVPAVTHDNYPHVGTTEGSGKGILEPRQRAALEQNIARTGVEHSRNLEQRLQAESENAANAY